MDMAEEEVEDDEEELLLEEEREAVSSSRSGAEVSEALSSRNQNSLPLESVME